jgi:signal transduction histidine kinase
MAHDLNNLLAVVRWSTGVVLEGRASPAERDALLRDALHAAELGSEVARRLLATSRGEAPPTSVVYVERVVGARAPLLRRLLGDAIRLEIDSGEPCPVRADVASLQRVLLNLLANAREAMPDGGVVRVRVARAAPGMHPLKARFDAECAHLVVRDDGVGMDSATRARAFEPRFSTKPLGAGLGLAVVRAAVARLGGCVELRTAPGRGAAFHLFLPLCEEDATARPTSRTVEARGSGPAR